MTSRTFTGGSVEPGLVLALKSCKAAAVVIHSASADNLLPTEKAAAAAAAVYVECMKLIAVDD